MSPARRNHHAYTSQRRVAFIHPCPTCGAEDSRDDNHKQGCPRLPRVSAAEMHRLSALVIEGWRRDQLQIRIRKGD
jgi:hypothetical protein